MDYKKSYFIKKIGQVATFIAFFVALAYYQQPVVKGFFAVIGVIILALTMLQYCIFCVCPHCGYLFSVREKLPKYCPECGKKLE